MAALLVGLKWNDLQCLRIWSQYPWYNPIASCVFTRSNYTKSSHRDHVCRKIFLSYLVMASMVGSLTTSCQGENSEAPQKISNGTLPVILLTSDAKSNQVNTPSKELCRAVSLSQNLTPKGCDSAACLSVSGTPDRGEGCRNGSWAVQTGGFLSQEFTMKILVVVSFMDSWRLSYVGRSKNKAICV